jgi:hypothetical protein
MTWISRAIFRLGSSNSIVDDEAFGAHVVLLRLRLAKFLDPMPGYRSSTTP